MPFSETQTHNDAVRVHGLVNTTKQRSVGMCQMAFKDKCIYAVAGLYIILVRENLKQSQGSIGLDYNIGADLYGLYLLVDTMRIYLNSFEVRFQFL